jgi:hypothetical protein
MKCSLHEDYCNEIKFIPYGILQNKRGAEISYIYVGLEFFTAVTMKNAVFWDITTQFVLHRRHITSPLQSPAG